MNLLLNLAMEASFWLLNLGCFPLYEQSLVGILMGGTIIPETLNPKPKAPLRAVSIRGEHPRA